jgi:hypothetical protein
MPKYLFAAETNGCVLEDGSEAVADETNNAPIKPHNHHLQPTQSPPFPQVFSLRTNAKSISGIRSKPLLGLLKG